MRVCHYQIIGLKKCEIDGRNLLSFFIDYNTARNGIRMILQERRFLRETIGCNSVYRATSIKYVTMHLLELKERIDTRAEVYNSSATFIKMIAAQKQSISMLLGCFVLKCSLI